MAPTADSSGASSPEPPPWLNALSGFLDRFREAIAPLVNAARQYFEGLDAIADTFRCLMPLGAEGWALSTYGLVAAPEAHRDAAAQMPALTKSCTILEEGWSDPEAQLAICRLVPYVYPPDQRPIALRRQQLLERASEHHTAGRYEEAVLLLYSQLDGIFQDKADAGGEQAFARLFSRRPVKHDGGQAKQFTDLVRDSDTMTGTEEEFYLVVRDAMTEGVNATTLEDNPSRHGVLHGRVLGYGNRRRSAQAFAFLAASVELLIALQGQPMVTDEEGNAVAFEDTPEGLNFILLTVAFSPVRSVFIVNRSKGKNLLVAVDDEQDNTPGAA